LSQGQIGAVSAPISAFYRRSLGGFSVVSGQPCPFNSVLGQKWVRSCREESRAAKHEMKKCQKMSKNVKK